MVVDESRDASPPASEKIEIESVPSSLSVSRSVISQNEKCATINWKKYSKTIGCLVVGILLVVAPNIGAIIANAEFQDFLKEQKQDRPALSILVHLLNGLIVNLRMGQASHLSTLTNSDGKMTFKKFVRTAIDYNLYVQCNAIGLTVVGSAFAITATHFIYKPLNDTEALLILASGMATSISSGLVADVVLGPVIWVARKSKINPDHIAPPLASSLGSIMTFLILGRITSTSVAYSGLPLAILLICFIWAVVVAVLIFKYDNPYRKHLNCGWVPLLVSMMISGGLHLARRHLEGDVGFQPILIVPCVTVALVYASKLSSFLHASQTQKTPETSKTPETPKTPDTPETPKSPDTPETPKTPETTNTPKTPDRPEKPKTWENLKRALFTTDLYRKTPIILMAISVIGTPLFNYVHVAELTGYQTLPTPSEVMLCAGLSLITVGLLLYVTNMFVHALWRCKKCDIDRDIYAIASLIALCDIVGFVFFFVTDLNQ